MNHIYRLVWNTKRRMLMAVAEVGTSHGKDGVTDTPVGRVVSDSAETFQGTRKILAAAVIALFPLASFAQMSSSPDEIPEGSEIYLSDSDGTNADAANWRLENNGTLHISGTDNGTNLLSLSGSGSVLLGDKTLTLTSADGVYDGTIQGAGGFTVDRGYETLSAANTYTGATTIREQGRLVLSDSGAVALSSGVLNNGVFDVAATNNGAQVQSLSGSGAVLLGGQTLTLTNANDQFAGTINGWGGLTVAGGHAVLSGANTYTGVTTVDQ
jgi:fibronectin-binding autotransporter adhesin